MRAMNDPAFLLLRCCGLLKARLGGTVVTLLLSLLFLIPACDPGESSRKVDLSNRTTITTQKQIDSYTYAYLPQYSHRVSYKRHHRLVEYLRSATDLPLRQVFPDSFEDHIQMVGRGEIDISFSNPLVYIRIADSFGAEAFAKIVENNGRAQFRGQIICRKDNKAIQTLQDCQNKRWIAVDPTSAGGYLFALDHFMRHGLTKEDFRTIAFAPGPGGKQEKVVQSVYLGEYDVGSIREGTLSLVADRVDLDAIRILATTRWYPGWVYAARQGLDPQVVSAVKQALLKLDPQKPKHQEILDRANFQGVVPAADTDFDPIRSLARNVGVR